MNAHENPFRSSEIAKLRYRLSAAELGEFVERVLNTSMGSSIVGPKGPGKTTLMEDLQQPLEARGVEVVWIRLTLESNRAEKREAINQLKQIGPKQIVLLDGGEVLTFWEWRSIRKRMRQASANWIATLHQPRGLPVLHSTQPDWSLAQDLVKRLAGQNLAESLMPVAEHSFRSETGNVREVFRACYWACARM